MTNITKYKISDTEYLKINPECIHDHECKTCAQIDIDYVDEKNNICIKFGYTTVSSFCYFLTKYDAITQLLKGTRILDKAITHDLGFEWNQFYKGEQKSNEAFKYHWRSNDHKEIRPYYNSWLYNDENGNIIFEITPFYPWHNTTKKTHPEKISYKLWIKDYKPVVKTIIPKENLKQWIKQTDEFEKKYKVKF
jgi:hypothetical protein